MIDKIFEFLNGPLPRRILFFDDMLTPDLIRAAYWLGLLAVVWTGLGHLFTNGFFGIFEGLVYIAIGSIALRVVAELVMLLFKLHENMEEVAKNTRSTVKLESSSNKKVSKKVAKKATKKVTKKSS